jgi:hypothetical protein
LKRSIAFTLACSLFAGAAVNAAGAASLTPMQPGFHQLLKCNGGYVTIDVAALNRHDVAPPAVQVTTSIAVGSILVKTPAIREVEHDGSITSLGYLTDKGFKRFPKRVLLPAVPVKAGERSEYFNITGDVIEKRYDGLAQTRDAGGKPVSGYAFSDHIKGHKLNTVVYWPPLGVAEARFYAIANGADLVCRAAPAKP